MGNIQSESRLKNYYKRGCESKVKYNTLHDAIQYVGIAKEKWEDFDDSLEAYKCIFCNGYHVGKIPY